MRGVRGCNARIANRSRTRTRALTGSYHTGTRCHARNGLRPLRRNRAAG